MLSNAKTLDVPQEPSPGQPPKRIVDAERTSAVGIAGKEGERSSAAVGPKASDRKQDPPLLNRSATQKSNPTSGMSKSSARVSRAPRAATEHQANGEKEGQKLHAADNSAGGEEPNLIP